MKQIISIIFLIIFAIVGFNYFAENSNESLLSEVKEKILNTSDDNEEYEDDDDDDDDEVNTRQQLVDGSLVVKLSKETQRLAGIKTSLSENITVQSEDRAYATIIDINELFRLRSEYKNMLAERGIKRTVFKNSTKSLEQLKVLHKEASNISARELQEARAKWEEDRAHINAIDTKLNNIRENLIQKWNLEITELALKDSSEIFDRLQQREEFLIMVTLKPEQQLSTNTAFVFVNRDDKRSQARKAYYISAAPFSDSTLQGETYFFRTNADRFRIGMRLYVWLPETGFTGEGVKIPQEAIVWYAGKPWAYVQIDDELFSRRSLVNPINTSGDWLVRENFNVGEQIVISGAQTLLSEEFKWAIPDEDDD